MICRLCAQDADAGRPHVHCAGSKACTCGHGGTAPVQLVDERHRDAMDLEPDLPVAIQPNDHGEIR